MWPGSIGTEDFLEAVYEFAVESRSDFTKDSVLRGYDNRREDWPKCMHGEDCGFVRWVDPLPIHSHTEFTRSTSIIRRIVSSI